MYKYFNSNYYNYYLNYYVLHEYKKIIVKYKELCH